MSDAPKPEIDEATVAALLAAAGASALVPPERRAALLPALAFIVAAGERLAAAEVDELSPIGELWQPADHG